jgi:dolichol-phosphate mannosyltransferase
MVTLWREGYKVVIPQRRSRVGEPAIKKAVSYFYYWALNRLSRVAIPRNCGEYRLLDRQVVEELLRLRESHCFLRGLTSVVGFKTKLLPFDRKQRVDGVGKYNRWIGSVRIGVTGLIAFSDCLLTFLFQAGLLFAGGAVVAALALAGLKVFTDLPLPGAVAGLTVLLLFLTGVHLLGMGILGAYLGRVYDEAKGRPLYVVANTVGFQAEAGVVSPAERRGVKAG